MPAVHYQEDRFPPDARLDWQRLIPLLGPAAAALARYDGALATIQNPQVLLSPLAMREAVLSSRIEGTQATVGDVLRFEAGQTPESSSHRHDVQEILNYRAAMRRAEEMLGALPLCQRVIREAHAILMHGVRGAGKSPGAYRRIPNWIGPPGCTIETARFIPVEAQRLSAAMDAWERYMHADAPDRLVQLAVLHAEFEAIHPFLDGNGRLGRMLVPLFLWQCGLIRTPWLHVSAYFEAHREAYYDGLLAVSRDDDWTGWCGFFLEALRQQAEEDLAKAERIVELYDAMKRRVAESTRSQYAIHALDWIFGKPIFRGADFVKGADIPPASAQRILRALRAREILKTVVAGRGRRPNVFVFQELLEITDT